MMRPALFLALFIGGAASIGHAQEWSGPYVGAGVGVSAGHVSPPHATDHGLAGFTGDFRAGYLFDAGTVLLGPELLLSAGSIGGRIDHTNGFWRYRRVDGSASLRLKLALPHDRFLPYAAVGATVASAAYNSSADYEISTTALGATAAAGVEMDLGNGWSIVGEVAATNYGTVIWQYPGAFGIREEAALWTGGLSLGVNYRF